MNGALLPLIIGFLAGNEKARNQVMLGVQQIAGSGIDFLNNMNGKQNQGDVNAESNKSN